MNKYVCVHGHFYQPPRENPWLERIELQESAHPYHDWNERITAECYAPNGVSRMLDADGEVAQIVNNYAHISFNFGPTLLSWLEREAADAYRRVLDADAESRDRFGGHGSALAQAYNHMILPLASRRDKETQVLWGIADFRARFGRDPEGMWLPETACDLETLEVMAAHGIRFTVLSPFQAGSTRKLGQSSWRDVKGGRIDPTRAYRQRLPGGADITIFFYDGPISQAIAFERLLHDGRQFAERLRGAFSDQRQGPQLVHIATDGESYGHHHRFGDMALASALDQVSRGGQIELINYGAYLERHPPEDEVQILEFTSWSCAHGVERWRSDCGCHTGGQPGWNQAWRKPLREALDGLRDQIEAVFTRVGRGVFGDPWRARDEYIEVVLDRSRATIDRFLDRHATGPRSSDRDVRALQLLEMQRHAMLMYTSCGWFFADLAGIETVQVIQYAGRAIQLGESVSDEQLAAPFLDALARAHSNLPDQGDGRHIYETSVMPAAIDLVTAGSHFAVSTLFEDYPETVQVYCYEAQQLTQDVLVSGKTRLGMGRARVASQITLESTEVDYMVLHLGDHNISGGAAQSGDREKFEWLQGELRGAFDRMDVAEILGRIHAYFGDRTFTLRTLFRDEQRKYLHRILKDALAKAEEAYVQVYRTNAPVMRFLAGLGLPSPSAFGTAAERALNYLWLEAVGSDGLNVTLMRELLQASRDANVKLDGVTLGFAYRRKLDELASSWRGEPANLELLEQLTAAVELIESLPFEVDLWAVQNIYHEVQDGLEATDDDEPADRDTRQARWRETFRALGHGLKMRVA